MKKELFKISNDCLGILHPDSDRCRMTDGIYTDSRQFDSKKLFAAIRGETVDGNSFAQNISERGGCALIDREECFFKNCILVPDVREALRRLASVYRTNELKNVKTVGITGSVGKTTTKDMVALAVSSSLKVHKTKGNANSQIGLPITVLDTDEDDDVSVLELGMSYKGEMDRIAKIAMPDISVITNIGHSHIENLGSREAIRDEKVKICAYSEKGSYLILNGDEPLLREISAKDRKIIYVSLNDHSADCFASDIKNSENGVSFTANAFSQKIKIELSVIGKHFILNSLFALAVCHILGIDLQKAAEALSGYTSDGKRQYVYDIDGHKVISDCYNASPESMEAAISVLSDISSDRKIAVLGDMLELGENSPMYHREVGKYLRGKADVLITYGKLAKEYKTLSDIKETYSFDEGCLDELKEFLKSFVRSGDAVLYKASNGMKLFNAIV